MPTAITAINAMSGFKRKSAPEKDVHAKGNKKVKVELGLNTSMKSKSKSAPVKIVEESSDSEDISENSDSAEGAPLDSSLDEEEEDIDAEQLPKAADGLHPDRAKAVVTSSTLMPLPWPLILITYRSIVEGSSCETEAIGTRKKGCKASS